MSIYIFWHASVLAGVIIGALVYNRLPEKFLRNLRKYIIAAIVLLDAIYAICTKYKYYITNIYTQDAYAFERFLYHFSYYSLPFLVCVLTALLTVAGARYLES